MFFLSFALRLELRSYTIRLMVLTVLWLHSKSVYYYYCSFAFKIIYQIIVLLFFYEFSKLWLFRAVGVYEKMFWKVICLSICLSFTFIDSKLIEYFFDFIHMFEIYEKCSQLLINELNKWENYEKLKLLNINYKYFQMTKSHQTTGHSIFLTIDIIFDILIYNIFHNIWYKNVSIKVWYNLHEMSRKDFFIFSFQ